MKKSIQKTKKQTLKKDERGLSTVEYIIILILIAVGGIALWTAFGETVGEQIGNATSEVEGLGN